MKRLAAALAGLAIVAAVVVLSGVISVKASSGHLPVTAWLLDFVKVRSVSTRALGITVPPLDEPGLIRVGASHFDRSCRPCHGTQWQAPPLVPARMTPHPPDLATRVGRWRERELFYLVAHGVKFTGMPAWPAASRTDEAWAVVAFLRALPSLEAAEYAQLASGVGSGASPLASCLVGCHRDDVTMTPRLRGQSAAYLQATLDAYADGRRFSGLMQPIAAALEPSRRADVAALLGASPGPAADGAEVVAEAPTERVRGSLATIVFQGDPTRDVPPCAECHGPTTRRRDPRFPALAGQPAAYLRLQLRLFAEGRRGGTSYADIMRPIALRLTDAQIHEATGVYAALSPRNQRQ